MKICGIFRSGLLGMLIVLFAIMQGCADDKIAAGAGSPPILTSPAVVEAVPGDRLVYLPTYQSGTGHADAVISFAHYPSWLTVSGDTLAGVPPLGAADTGFAVIAVRGSRSDTMPVAITFPPAIAVYGDSRTNHDAHRAVVSQFMKARPKIVFHTGDLVENGDDSALWVIFNSITAPVRAMAPMYPALGNHDKQSRFFFDDFTLPNNEQWYTVDADRCHFIVLNSCVATDTASEQYQWLAADLNHIADSVKFVIAVFHHPPYSNGTHAEDEKGLRNTWVPLFQKHGVNIVFNGHDHNYQRAFCGQIYYIVAGGGGAPLYDASRQTPCNQVFKKSYHFCLLSVPSDRLIVHTYDSTGEIIDRFEVSSRIIR